MPIQPTTVAPAPQEFVNYLQRALVYGQITEKDFNPSSAGQPGTGRVSFPTYADRETLENMARAVQFGQITASEISSPTTLNASFGGPAPSDFVDRLRGPLVSGQVTGTDFGLSFSPFSPSTISGLRLWLDAEVGVNVDGSNAVVSWSDQSGNGHDAVPFDNFSAPTYEVSSKNSKPSLVFDETACLTTSNIFNGASPRSMIVAYYVGNNNELSQSVIGQPNIFGQETGSIFYIQSRGDFLNSSPYFAGYADDLSGPPFIENEWLIAMADYDGTTVRLFKNGSLVNSGEKTLDTRDYPFCIGALNDAGSISEFLNGKILEVCVYNKSLNSLEISNIHNYLNQKYAIY